MDIQAADPSYLIINAKIYTGSAVLLNKAILVRAGLILDL